MTKILPPPELSPRIVPRDSPHLAIAEAIAGAVHARVIRWRDLVVATWQLGDDEQYTGELPAGLSSQQFWAKVTRAAGRMGGSVGVAVRGRRWWVWTVERGRVEREVLCENCRQAIEPIDNGWRHQRTRQVECSRRYQPIRNSGMDKRARPVAE